MDVSLSDEQEFLREAARGALSRVDTVAAAREAGDEGASALPDLWPTAKEAGWPGLLVRDESGGAGLGVFDAMLVSQEAGRRLAGIGLLGHVPASLLLDLGGYEKIADVASGDLRAAFAGAQPPSDVEERWTTDPASGMERPVAPQVSADGTLSGDVAWVPDAPGADVIVVIAVDESGEAVALAVEGAEVEETRRYDLTRSLGHVKLDGVTGTRLDVGREELERAWYVAQALLAAESIGTVEQSLEISVAYAKERFTFGRPIGSYQAIKHGLVEVLRLQEVGRALLLYAGWAGDSGHDEFALAASAARSAAGNALDYATREMIAVHGGIGATWEHDAPWYYRRAQLSRRLLGGDAGATDRVAGEVLASAHPVLDG
jgi:alkylation response protein AidB-like acyl-CoA dehydrogenase